MPRGGPVRFKACFTCRARKVKCDEKRPSCVRCQKSGFVCEGYLPTLDFVDETQTVGKSTNSGNLMRSKRNGTVHRQQLITQPSKPPDLTCFEQDISIAYLLANLITIPGAPGIELAPRRWPGFLAIHSQQSLSYECLCAFSRIFFARKNHVQSTMLRGLETYGSALKKLNKVLRSSHSGDSDDVLISSMILSMYEFMTARSADGWIAHCLGYGNLLRLRGPDAYRSGFSQYLLEYNRFTVVLASLATGQSTFLSLPDWKWLPWIEISELHDSLHKLVDIYVDLPGVKHDALAFDQTTEPHELRIFFLKCLSIISELQAWRKEWSTLAECQISVVESTLDPGDDLSPFPTCFVFSTFWAAHSLILYNAAIIQIVEIIKLADAATRISARDDTILPAATLRKLASLSKTAARDICQSLEYQTKEEFGNIGQLMVLFPMRMAWKALGRGSSPEGQWLECHLDLLATSGLWQCATQTITFDVGSDISSSSSSPPQE